MKNFDYEFYDFYSLPNQHDLGDAVASITDDDECGWELVSVVPYKDHGRKHFRAYFKREVTE